MDPILSILENRGLYLPELVEAFAFRSNFDEIKKVQEELQAALDQRASVELPLEHTLSAFNFLASSSLRGESVCDALDCRLRKINLLLRYATLYCDHVAIPIQFLPAHEKDESDLRYSFFREVVCVLTMRPAIEAHIIKLLPAFLCYCPRCMPIIVPQQPDIFAVAAEQAKRHWNKFKFIYEPDGKRGYPITIKGPEEYLEHGQRFMLLRKRPAWFPKELKKAPKHQPIELAPDIVRDSGYVEDFFEEIGRDVTLQQFYGMRYDTKYLTDRPGEAEFLRSLNKEHEIAKQTATLCARLAHSIPLFADVPIEIVARIRRDDHEAFQQYRAALGDIVQKYVASGRAIGDAEANEIFLDELAPKLMQLERKARLERRAALKKSFLKTAITSAVVGLGIYGGILPSHLVELCKMVGGVKLASDVAETFSSVEKYSTEVRNHNLFFLLRVKQDTHA